MNLRNAMVAFAGVTLLAGSMMAVTVSTAKADYIGHFTQCVSRMAVDENDPNIFKPSCVTRCIANKGRDISDGILIGDEQLFYNDPNCEKCQAYAEYNAAQREGARCNLNGTKLPPAAVSNFSVIPGR